MEKLSGISTAEYMRREEWDLAGEPLDWTCSECGSRNNYSDYTCPECHSFQEEN